MPLTPEQRKQLRQKFDYTTDTQPTVSDRIQRWRDIVRPVEEPQFQSQQQQQEQPQPKKPTSFLEKVTGASEKFLETGKEFIAPAARGLTRPFVQAKAGVEGLIPGGKTGKEPVPTPFGEIKPIGTEGGLKQSGFETLDLALLGLPVEKLAIKPLQAIAKKLFGSAFKAKNVLKGGKVIVSADDLIKTGLDEKILVTSGIVEKVGSKIDDVFSVIDDAIAQGKAAGKKIKTEPLINFMDDLNNFFRNQVDVKGSKEAIKQIDDITENFLVKFGDEIPIEVAQTVKKNTNALIRKSFGQLTAASTEGQKQIARFLKEGVLEKAPIVGTANKRAKALIEFEKFAIKASNRISSSNLLGFPAKVGGAVAGGPGLVAGKLLELVDSPALKSAAAIGIDQLAKLAGKGVKAGRISLVALVNEIAKIVQGQEEK